MTTLWMELPFGKHFGMTAPQIVLRDPDWLYWANGNARPGPLSYQIEVVCDRACCIRLPLVDGVPQVVDYVVDRVSGKLADVQVFPCPRADSQGFSHVLDLSLARWYQHYDKCGSRMLVRAVKQYVLKVRRITRELADDFFADESNFAVCQ